MLKYVYKKAEREKSSVFFIFTWKSLRNSYHKTSYLFLYQYRNDQKKSVYAFCFLFFRDSVLNCRTALGPVKFLSSRRNKFCSDLVAFTLLFFFYERKGAKSWSHPCERKNEKGVVIQSIRGVRTSHLRV